MTISSQDIAEASQVVNRSYVAALAFLAYDILITLDDEIDLVWNRSWSFMKIHYFFVRYVPLLVQIPLLLVGSELSPHFHFTRHACYIWQVYQGITTVLILSSVDYILVARIYAFYFHHRTVKIIVGIAYVLNITLMCVGLGFTFPGIEFDSNCVVISVPSGVFISGGAYVLFQTLLFALTLYRFILSVRAGWGHVPIIRLLMKDGTWAFFVLFIQMVSWQASLYGLKNKTYSGAIFGWILSASSVCGYRIFLNISSIAASNAATNAPTRSPIRFNSHTYDE